jgi:hypothetical protein
MNRIKNEASNNCSIFGRVFVAAETFLLEALPTNGMENIHTDRLMEGFMEYSVDLGSGAMI